MVNSPRRSPETMSRIEVDNLDIDTNDLLTRLEDRVNNNIDITNRENKIRLAEKIRRIKEQNESSNPEELKAQLESQLTDIDREIINGIYNNQDSNSSSAEQMLGDLEKGVGFLEKWEKKFSNSQEIYDKISKAKGGISGTLLGFIAAIKYFFSGKVGELPEGVELSWLENERSEEEQKNDEVIVEGSDRMPENATYNIALIILLKMGEQEKNTYNILADRNIADSNFYKLKEFTKNGDSSGILEKLGIPYNQQNKKSLEKEYYDAIIILLQRDSFINDTIGGQKKDWRNELSVRETIVQMYKYTKTYETISDMSFKDFLKGDINFGNFEFSDLTDPRSDLSEKFNQMRENRESPLNGVSGVILTQIITSNRGNINNETTRNSLDSRKEEGNENDEKFLDIFYEFSEKITETIKKDFFAGNEDDRPKFELFVNERGISPKEAFELFLITGGKHSSSELNGAEKGLIFFKVWRYMGDNEYRNLRGKTYTRAVVNGAQGIMEDGGDMVPEPVINIFKTMAKSALDSGVDFAKGMFNEIWGLLTTEQKIKYGAILTTVGIAYWRLGPLKHWLSGATTVVSIVLITKMVSDVMKNDEFKNSKHYGMSESELVNRITSELKEYYGITN